MTIWVEDLPLHPGTWIESTQGGKPHSLIGNPYLFQGQRYDEETGHEEGDEDFEKWKKDNTYPEDPNEFDPGEDYERDKYKDGDIIKWKKKGETKHEWEAHKKKGKWHYHHNTPGEKKKHNKHPITGDEHHYPGDIRPDKIEEIDK